MGVIGLLCQGNAQSAGVDGALSNESVIAILGLDGRAPQGLAVADQLVQTTFPTWDLADHPGLVHLPEFLQMGLIEQVEEGRIRWPALEIQAQGPGSAPPGAVWRTPLQITRAPAAAQDSEHRHQQQEPLRVTHPPAVTAIGDRLEEGDQIIRCAQISYSGADFGHRER